jgi:membrane protein required for colicin V production
MELSDIIILVVLGVFGIRGLFNGLIMEVLSLGGLCLGFLVSYKYFYYLANFLQKFNISSNYSRYISYVVTFLIVYIIIIIIAKILSKFLRVIRLGWANRSGGFLFGVFKGGILIGILLTLVFAHIKNEASFKKSMEKAPVTKYLLEMTPKAFDYLNEITNGNKENPFNQLI